MANRAVRPSEHEVVGTARTADGEIRLWGGLPVVGELTTIPADHLPARDEGGVETRGADNEVKVLLALGGLDACLGDALDGIKTPFCVGLLHGF